MISKIDAHNEYQKELDRYWSQQVVIKAIMAVKDDVEKIEPDMAASINVTYLSNELKMDREEVDSLFGTKPTSQSLALIQKAKLMKYLATKIKAQCNDVNSFARTIKLEEKFNVFQIENIKKQIESLLTEYNEKLVQLVHHKEKLCHLESIAVQYKTGAEQRKQLEMYRLQVKSKIIENERFKRIMLHKICNQTPRNTEALLKLKEFVEDMS